MLYDPLKAVAQPRTGLTTAVLPAVPQSSYASHMLPGSRPLSAIKRDYLRVCRAFVQLYFEWIGIPFDKPGQRVPVLFSRRTPANLVPPCLAARFRFVHQVNIRSGEVQQRSTATPAPISTVG